MKVSIDISAEYKEPFAVIHTDKVTSEIQRVIDVLGSSETPITALQNEEDIVVLQPKDIFMVRVEDGDTVLSTRGPGRTDLRCTGCRASGIAG